MIPLRYSYPGRKAAYVTRGLIAVNVAMFLVQLFSARTADLIVNAFGFIPARLLHPAAFRYTFAEALLTLVTSLFLHGGYVHLAGNMIYLGVFGGGVESLLGRWRYLIFYLACGVAGSLVHMLVFPTSHIASIGASGSIAGVLGAFLVLRTRARIVTLFPLIVYWAIAEVPAIVFLPIWFGLQFFNGFLAITSASRTEEVAGVAWWAHVGGFLFGAAWAAAVRVMKRRRTVTP